MHTTTTRDCCVTRTAPAESNRSPSCRRTPFQSIQTGIAAAGKKQGRLARARRKRPKLRPGARKGNWWGTGLCGSSRPRSLARSYALPGMTGHARLKLGGSAGGEEGVQARSSLLLIDHISHGSISVERHDWRPPFTPLRLLGVRGPSVLSIVGSSSSSVKRRSQIARTLRRTTRGGRHDCDCCCCRSDDAGLYGQLIDRTHSACTHSPIPHEGAGLFFGSGRS